MVLFNFSKVLVIATFIAAEVAASAQLSSDSGRVLKAATKKASLFRRDVRIRRSYEASLPYIETENDFTTESIFGSELLVKSDAPILSLEDNEHHLSDVQCSDTRMKLEFVSEMSARDAHNACMHDDGGYIITSHDGCNDEGERTVYKIHDMALSQDGLALELETEQVLFKDAFKALTIKFGYTTEEHLFRRHPRFRRRDDDDDNDDNGLGFDSIVSAVTSRAGDILPTSGTPTSANASPTSSSDAQVSTQDFPLNFSSIDTTFKSPAPAGFGILNPLEQLPLEVGCRNCTTSGIFRVTEGAFDISLTNPRADNALDLIEGGFLEVEAIDVAAYLELFAKPAAVVEFDVELFSLPIFNFQIPRLGDVGIKFAAIIHSELEVNGGIEFTFGLKTTVPNGSKFRIDFADLDESFTTGFSETSVEALPFQANITDIELRVATGFRPTFPVGFEFLNEQFVAQVSAFMDLPSLEAKISTQLQPMDASCNLIDPPSNSTNSTATSASSTTSSPSPTLESYEGIPVTAVPSLLSSLGPLIHVEPAVILRLGFGAQFNASILSDFGFETAITVLEVEFALPTACLAATSGFPAATAVFAEITSSYLAANPSPTAPTAPKDAADVVASGVPEANATSPGFTGSASWTGGEAKIWSLMIVMVGAMVGGIAML